MNASLTCQSEESVRQYGLGQHAVLDLVETDGLVVPPPVPAGDVEQVALHTAILREKHIMRISLHGPTKPERFLRYGYHSPI